MNRLLDCGMRALVLLAFLAPQAPAQQRPNAKAAPAAEPGFADERDPRLAQWKWVFSVQPLPMGDERFLALPLPTAVFGKARPDLNDLRLVDANGKHVPYVLRLLNSRMEQNAIPVVRRFNEGPNPPNRRYKLALELGNIPPSGYNEIEIHSPGKNFRRRVEAFGDNSEKFSDVVAFLGKGKYLVHYDVDHHVVDIHRFRFEPKHFRFVEVVVYADGDEDMPTIDKVSVRYTQVIPGEFVTEPAGLERKGEEVRADGQPGTAWFINLPGPMPCQKLTFEMGSEPSDRPFHLEAAEPNQPRQPLPITDWQWLSEGPRRLLEISFPETMVSRLRFTVTDSANEPLVIQNVTVTRAVRQVVFARPHPAKFTMPLQLFTGNELAGAPNYDLAQKLPVPLKLLPPYGELGEVRQNPAYVPPQPDLNERMPWLIYTVLGAACVILLVILGTLARQAIRRHDQEVTPAAGP